MFEGTIVDQRAVLINAYNMTTAAIDYDVRLTRVWKGTPVQTVHVLRVGLCDPAFRVGKTYLIYAGSDERNRLVAAGCTRTKPAEDAATDVAELGASFVKFERATAILPAAMPVRRRVRAYAVLGLVVYASMFSEWREALVSVEAVWLAAVMLQMCLGVACVRRRRWKPGALFLGAFVPTALFAIIWSGHRLLQNEWWSPFLMW